MAVLIRIILVAMCAYAGNAFATREFAAMPADITQN